MAEFRICFGVLTDRLVDELGVIYDRKRGQAGEIFSLHNLVVFPFTEMGKTEEKTGLWRKLTAPFRLC